MCRHLSEPRVRKEIGVSRFPSTPQIVPSSSPTSPRPGAATPAIPSLEQLERLLSAGDRAVWRNVDWAFFERLIQLVDEHRGFRIAFDGRDLEVMSPGPLHEDIAEFAGRFIEVVTEELNIACRSLASTTWKRPEIGRGIQADQCYYFDDQKLVLAAAARKRMSNNVADYPNPDLAIEVDVSPSKVDRPAIYAALGVSEVWRFDGVRILVERLRDDGTYELVDSSRFAPIRADEINRWVLEEDTSNLVDWRRRIRVWARAELTGRPREE
jgi:Uma2 family endonuclease